MLVRSWNVFHGRRSPPDGRIRLREMVELATDDAPEVVCLQELPLWALARLAGWSGMTAVSAVTKRALVPRELGGLLQRWKPLVFRSAITGQANAILVSSAHTVLEHRSVQISDPGRERRVSHAVRLDGVVVGNVHATNDFRRPEVPEAELVRAYALVDAMASRGEARVLAGDFNFRDPSLPGPNIDHIVVAGIEHGPLVAWPEARRSQNGAVLSDHAPVEVTIG